MPFLDLAFPTLRAQSQAGDAMAATSLSCCCHAGHWGACALHCLCIWHLKSAGSSLLGQHAHIPVLHSPISSSCRHSLRQTNQQQPLPYEQKTPQYLAVPLAMSNFGTLRACEADNMYAVHCFDARSPVAAQAVAKEEYVSLRHPARGRT